MAMALVNILSGYHTLATDIWATKPPPTARARKKGPSLPLSKASLRRMTRLAHLRNACGALIKAQNRPDLPDFRTGPHGMPDEAAILQEARDTLGEDCPAEPEEIQEACRKEIRAIRKVAQTEHEKHIEHKENAFFDTNRKLYHKGLKVDAGLLHKSGTLPDLDTVHTTHGPSSDPVTVTQKVKEFFEEELRSVTPDPLPRPPWEDPEAPDPYTLRAHNLQATQPANMSYLLHASHYETAVARLALGKAPGPDGIPNEVIKHLPQQAHDAIYLLFNHMGSLNHTPHAWCISATCLLFKPNKKDPLTPASYRPIALMNCILKLWTSVLKYIGSDRAESEGMINDNSDGFRENRQTYDSLLRHIMMLEDAKTSKKPIYTAFADFKGAFNGTDHKCMFQTMRDLGMPECYVRTCEQLYAASSTAYITPHGLTPQIPIHRGTLQGDTLSPFLFTLFLEPLMRWLQSGGRGYTPTCTAQCEGEFAITYDEHGYADDISITTGSLADLKIQLRKLHLFSQYTGLQLEIPKCEVTGALWDRGNPASKENLLTLKNQIATIDLTGIPGGPSMKFLPPTKSYKMLGVHINPLLNFTEHFRHVTGEVTKIAAVLRRRRLSPFRKQQVIEQLLQAKYHAVHLGIFTDSQMDQIDKTLATATRNAYQLTPGFPTEALRRNPAQFGLGCLPIRTRAAKMGLSHLVDTMNKATERGLIATEHIRRVSTLFSHWPEEAFDTDRANLPTIRLLRYIQSVPGLELEGIPPLSLTNAVADTIRAASEEVDTRRRAARNSFPMDNMCPKAYKLHCRSTRPLKASNRILKHFSPLWALGIHSWHHILSKSPRDQTVSILPTPAILTALLGQVPINSPALTAAKGALQTLRQVLSNPRDQEYSKLPPRTGSPDSWTAIHTSWLPHLPVPELPEHRQGLGPIPTGRYRPPPTHHQAEFLWPSGVDDAYYDVLKIGGRDYRGGQTRYYVTEWAPETLTQRQIDAFISEGFELQSKTPDANYGDPPPPEATFTVHWKPAWQLQETVLGAPSGPSALEEFLASINPKAKKRRTKPPPGPRTEQGWIPQHTTFRATPIQPDLDSYPAGSYRLRKHPTDHTITVIHDEAGQAKGVIDTDQLHFLYTRFDSNATHASFPEVVLQQVITQGRKTSTIQETPLKKAPEEERPREQDPARYTWKIPDSLYDALNASFPFDRIVHCTPLNAPTTARCHLYSDSPSASTFNMLPLTDQFWPGTTLSIPHQTPESLRKALEQAIYSAHQQKRHAPSATVLILPHWTHTPYMSKHLLGSKYVHKIMTVPASTLRASTTDIPPAPPSRGKHINIYLVANSRALARLTPTQIIPTLANTARSLYGTSIQVTLPVPGREEDTTITSAQKYTRADMEPPVPSPGDKPPLRIFPHYPMWDNTEFIYTDGSKITGKPTLGGAVVFPEDRTIRIEIKSQPERHTINRAELASIMVALRKSADSAIVKILTDSLFCIYSIRNYINSPYRYRHHLHRDLIKAVAELIRERDNAGLTTHIGKVKSHTGVAYNDVADAGAKDVATTKTTADTVFEEYDPPVGGPRTWPIVRIPSHLEDEPDRISRFTNLKAEPAKRYKEAAYAKVPITTLYGGLLQQSRIHGADHTIHAYSTSGFRQRREALEVAWGAHKYRLLTKANKHRFPACSKCGQKLTHTHLLGGCHAMQNARTRRHNSTFTLLHRLLSRENGGRWPILAMDLGRQPVTDFEKQLKDCRTEAHQAPDRTDPAGEGPMDTEVEEKSDERYKTILPEYILPKDKRPPHYKPDMVRAVGYNIDPDSGTLTPDPTYTGPRALQLIECKYATDTDMHEVIDRIHTIYNPLKQAIQDHGLWHDPIVIIPIVISRTGSFHVKTLAEIAQLISPDEEPPDGLTYRDLTPAARRLTMALHTHAQKWMTLLLSLSKQTLVPHPATTHRRRHT